MAQAGSSFKWLDTHMSTSTIPTSSYLATVVLNDCYNEVTAYTALGYCSFYNAYGFLGHAH